MTKESIKVIFVTLEIDGKPSLAILLTHEGLVNRMGSGTVDNTERDLFIGRANEPLFAQLRDKVQPEWLLHPGAYDVPEKVGRTCELSIILKASAALAERRSARDPPAAAGSGSDDAGDSRCLDPRTGGHSDGDGRESRAMIISGRIKKRQ